jgi:hypothetical protein
VKRRENVKTIAWWSDAGFVGTERHGEVEVEDDATEQQIEDAVRDVVFNHFSWGWDEKENPPE